MESPSTRTLATGRKAIRGPLGKWKDRLTSRGERVDTRAHRSRPGVQQAPRTAPVRPRSAHLHLVPPPSPSSRGLLLLTLRAPLSFLARDRAASCVPVAPFSRTDPGPGPGPFETMLCGGWRRSRRSPEEPRVSAQVAASLAFPPSPASSDSSTKRPGLRALKKMGQ